MRAFLAPLTSATEHPMTALRQRMIEDMKLRNLAPRTIEVYVERVATFAKHFGKSPDRLGPAEVRAYLLFLVQEKHASWSQVGSKKSFDRRTLVRVFFETPGAAN